MTLEVSHGCGYLSRRFVITSASPSIATPFGMPNGVDVTPHPHPLIAGPFQGVIEIRSGPEPEPDRVRESFLANDAVARVNAHVAAWGERVLDDTRGRFAGQGSMMPPGRSSLM